MLSETMQKKLTNHFHVRDLDKDGFVAREDWEQCARNLAEIRRWKTGSPDYEEVVSKHVQIWTTFWEPADLDSDGKVGLDEYLQLAHKQRERGSFETDIVLQLFIHALPHQPAGHIVGSPASCGYLYLGTRNALVAHLDLARQA